MMGAEAEAPYMGNPPRDAMQFYDMKDNFSTVRDAITR